MSSKDHSRAPVIEGICAFQAERRAQFTTPGHKMGRGVAADVLTSDGHEGKIYTLTGPVALGIADVARILAGVAGRDINYVDVPETAARNGMLQAGIPKWQVDALMELHAINKQNRWSAVTSDVEKVTGKPATDFAQFARDHVEKFRLG